MTGARVIVKQRVNESKARKGFGVPDRSLLSQLEVAAFVKDWGRIDVDVHQKYGQTFELFVETVVIV